MPSSDDNLFKLLAQTGDEDIMETPSMDMLATFKMLDDPDFKSALPADAVAELVDIKKANFAYVGEALAWMKRHKDEVFRLGGPTIDTAMKIAVRLKKLAKDKALEVKLLKSAGRAMRRAQTGYAPSNDDSTFEENVSGKAAKTVADLPNDDDQE